VDLDQRHIMGMLCQGFDLDLHSTITGVMTGAGGQCSSITITSIALGRPGRIRRGRKMQEPVTLDLPIEPLEKVCDQLAALNPTVLYPELWRVLMAERDRPRAGGPPMAISMSQARSMELEEIRRGMPS
jgi:hypothetical protein